MCIRDREWIAQDDNPGGQPPLDGSWLWPLPGYQPGSGYGWRTLNGKPDFHRGVDIPAPAMTPIRAAVGGVVSVQRHSSYGNCVKVSVGGGMVVIYAHMTVSYTHLPLRWVPSWQTPALWCIWTGRRAAAAISSGISAKRASASFQMWI